MATLSIRLPEDLLEKVDRYARDLHVTRAEYIRRAIEAENRDAAARQRRERMVTASKRVREASMRVNEQFDAIEVAPDA